jgi:hypothetical protein
MKPSINISCLFAVHGFILGGSKLELLVTQPLLPTQPPPPFVFSFALPRCLVIGSYATARISDILFVPEFCQWFRLIRLADERRTAQHFEATLLEFFFLSGSCYVIELRETRKPADDIDDVRRFGRDFTA